MRDDVPVSRRGLIAVGATAGVAASMPVRASAVTDASASTSGSSIDPSSVQLLFADLQSPLVAGSQDAAARSPGASGGGAGPRRHHTGAADVVSVVMEGSSPPHLLPALKPFSREDNTVLRTPVAPFHDRATVAAIAGRRRVILVIAGFAAEVVVLQAALDALAAGHEVFLVTDAIGSQDDRTEAAAFREMEMAGARPTSVLSLTTRMVPDFVGTPGRQVFAALAPLL